MQLSKPPALQASRVVAFIDIGTNSIRLFVVRIKPDCSYSVMSSQKEVVRLGEGEFEKNQIGPDAMNRAIMVAGRFVELARSFGAEEFVAVATSATREAKNRHMFLSRLRLESHLDVQVISGREEARLIYLGVTSALHIEDHHVMIIDIGGGSTEIAIGGQKVYSFLSSLKLGSIRLTNLFFPERYEKPVTKEQYETIRSYIREQLKPVLGEIKRHPADMFIGSSGTIINLCDIASGLFHPEEGKRTILNATELKKTVSYLCSLSLPERRKVQGINPDRADIIVAGAAIIDTLVQEIGIKSLEVTQRGLQDGLLADYLSRMDGYPLLGNLSVRERSVLQTGRSFGINEFHARTVSKLALDLFDSAKKEQLHDLEGLERELLEYAAFLHDIGSLISFQNHHEHSYYIIRNSNLLGFNSREINIMANIARFHRKKLPRQRDSTIPELSREDRTIMRKLAAFLRLAESLDRRHTALIEEVRFTAITKESADLMVVARGDCQFESWGVKFESKHFERVFGRKLNDTIQISEVPGDGDALLRKTNNSKVETVAYTEPGKG